MRRIIAGLLASVALIGGLVVSSAPAGSAPPDNYNERIHAQGFQVSGSYQPLVGLTSCVEDSESIFILWYAPGTAADYLWRIESADISGHTSEPLPINGVYEPLVGDFDGDGCDDIFWYAPGSGRDYIWYGSVDGFTSKAMTVNGSYEPVVERMSEDATDDVFWYAPGSGQEYIWDGHADRTFTSHIGPSVNGDYRVATYSSTWLFHKPGAGQDYIWTGVLAGATAPESSIPVQINGSYVPLAGPGTILLYGPGSAADFAIIDVDEESSQVVTIPATINGDYVPAVRSPRTTDFLFLWHAPGAASDHVWWGIAS
ncbi:hypothetical protein [Actinospongicola halichondriae]|uniref:hypothetical protein n=1 Tax=Actinospongicola halichondriae TaxID=3236844 RepID=UPI003D50AAB9